MWGLVLFMVMGVAKGPEGVGPPLPFLGSGTGDGLVLLSDLGTWYEWNERPEGEDEVTPVDANRSWLGPKSELFAVDAGRGMIVDVAPHPEVAAVAGARLEVVGAKERCEVEVVSGVKAILWFTHHLSEMVEPGDEPLSVVYRGPRLRVPPRRKTNESTEVVTAETLERDASFSPVRWTALRVKAVSGSCPLDGVAVARDGADPRLVEVVGRDGDNALADALRPAFRANKWIAKLTKEYRAELAKFGVAGVGCQYGEDKKTPPKHLDEGHFGLRTRVFEPEGGDAFALAYVGDPLRNCDPSNAAIVYRKDKAKWRQARELWGGPVKALLPELVVKDQKSGRLWFVGWPVSPSNVKGWELIVTGLDKPGAGTRWGDWPDAAAHWCNYESSPWEAASMCVFEEPTETE